ncbi:hypothetical protein KUTeg_003452 [Tegillarca granosa]|uniref:Tyr recombinase domain-containing protein n=1 Tax=Tegillarca granosa TaxID=220873 RepID=A0ABQ9FNT3_TEGGR|nr:hypothetical protein KUTeg_003452 [Tegillarca granosa]
MMPNLSAKAKLSRRYCNHYLRATSVHLHIMSVAGHKAETSLKTYYTGYTGEQIKQSMSDTISQGFRCSMQVTVV